VKQVTGATGRSGSFEVSVDGCVIYSKLKEGSFPQNDKVVEKVKKCIKAGQKNQTSH